MDQATLVNAPDMERGKTTLHALDEARLGVRSAFWRFFEEPHEWRLVVVTPEVDQRGPLAVYRDALKALSKLDRDQRIAVNLLSVVGRHDPIALEAPSSSQSTIMMRSKSQRERRAANR